MRWYLKRPRHFSPWLLLAALLASGCERSTPSRGEEGDAASDPADEIDDAASDPADEIDDADTDRADGFSAPAQPREAGADASAKDAGRPCDSGSSGDREWCFRCPQPCPAGRVWDTYVCNCIIPGRCDNGWVLCNLDTPACVDGKCFECSSEDVRRCRLAEDAGMRCDTEAHKCVTECPTACAPGTERAPDTCECFDYCANGCDPKKPGCRDGKCVTCSSGEHCPSQSCNSLTNECY